MVLKQANMTQENINYKELYEKASLELSQLKKVNSDFEKLRADKTFGVAVCGDVLLNKLEVAIVNTKDFQRLRKVRQLGTTYMVYPSAVHTRFEHSLGVLKQASEIIKNIRDNLHSQQQEKYISPEDEQIVRLLALLHDIGHMPFGHTIEDEFGIFRSHDKHETRWEYLLGEYSTIGKIIIKERGRDFHRIFFNLIKCEKDFHKDGLGEKAYLYDIVSNTVCADLLDYLNRDCFYTNLKLNYHPRFLNYFFIAEREVDYTSKGKKTVEKKNERRIAIRAYKGSNKKELRRDIISELIQLLRNRYYLGERVYYHHTKIMTGTLLAGAVLRAKSANMFEPIKITDSNLNGNIEKNEDVKEDKFLFNIHLMGDEELINYLINLSTKSKDEIKHFKINGAINLAKFYDERLLYKQLIYETKDKLGIEDEFDTDKINVGKKAKHDIATSLYNRFIKFGTADEKLTIEDNICEYLNMNSGEVLLYCPNFNMAMKLAKALMQDDQLELEELRNFQDKSIKLECKSIIDKHQALWACRVFVHPNYYNNDNDGLNEMRIDSINKYFDWILFSKDSDNEKKKGKIFWNSYFTYYLAKIELELNSENITSFKAIERQKMEKELSEELISMTHSSRTFKVISKLINDKFKINNVQ